MHAALFRVVAPDPALDERTRTVCNRGEGEFSDVSGHDFSEHLVTLTVDRAAVHPAAARHKDRRAIAAVVTREATDRAMMMRCIELSRIAAGKGEYPFGTVIALDGQIVAEGINSTIRDDDVTRHGELIALSQAQKSLGRARLRHSTLYSNIEPCAMCAYCIREAWVGRVVYALASPVMGGLSRWNILRDDGVSDRIPEVFGAVPEVVSGVLLHEAQQAWREWSPFVWEMIKLRGLLTAPGSAQGEVRVQSAHSRSLRHYLHILFMRTGQVRRRIGRSFERGNER